MINSRTPLFSATPQRLTPQECSHRRAPLLPKLRGHFAEFLNHSSPERLSILNLTTCVGLGYGPNMHSLEAFLDSTSTPHSPKKGYASRLSLNGARIYLNTSLNAYTNNPISGVATLLRHPITWTTVKAPHTQPITTLKEYKQ